MQQGMYEATKRLLIETLKRKFELVPVRVFKTIDDIENLEILEMLHAHTVKSQTTGAFEEKMKLTPES